MKTAISIPDRPRRSGLATVILAALALGLAGCGSGTNEATTETESAGGESSIPMMADYPSYSSAEEVVSTSTVIVQVEVLSTREEVMYPDVATTGDPEENPQAGLDPDEIDMQGLGVPVTIATVEVLETFKGDVAVGDELEITQSGGTMDGLSYVETSTVLLKDVDAASLVLFLGDLGDTLAPINPQAGVQAVEPDGETMSAASAKDGSVTTEDLGLTIPELASLVGSAG